MRKGTGSGRKDIRQLSALTEYGWLTMTETLESYPEVYLMRDEFFACANFICEKAAAEARRRNYDIIICPSHGLDNNACEHLLIPELGVALVSATPLNDLHIDGAKQLNLSRFYDKMAITRYRSRLKMNRIAAGSLADQVYSTIRSAKAVHDKIEAYYIEAMDFAAVDRITEKMIDEIENRR